MAGFCDVTKMQEWVFCNTIFGATCRGWFSDNAGVL